MVFLLHFDRGFKHARHYIGATDNPEHARQLARGTVPDFNIPLLTAARLAGVTFTVDRTWAGDAREAARLRNLGNSARLCGSCAIERREHGEAVAVAPVAPSTTVSTPQGDERYTRVLPTRRSAHRRVVKNGNSYTIALPLEFRSRLSILPMSYVEMTLDEERGGFFVKPLMLVGTMPKPAGT